MLEFQPLRLLEIRFLELSVFCRKVKIDNILKVLNEDDICIAIYYLGKIGAATGSADMICFLPDLSTTNSNLPS